MLSKAYGGEAVKKSGVFEWHKQFKEDCENVEDERSGRPRCRRTDENVEKVWNLVHSDRRLSIRVRKIFPTVATPLGSMCRCSGEYSKGDPPQ